MIIANSLNMSPALRGLSEFIDQLTVWLKVNLNVHIPEYEKKSIRKRLNKILNVKELTEDEIQNILTISEN